MPILQQQPSVYPPELLSDTTPDPAIVIAGQVIEEKEVENTRAWWMIYTRSRQEKSLARKLYAQQVPFYLPLVPHEHHYRGRNVKSHIPLFSNYMFMFCTEDERVAALKTNCVSRMLLVDGWERRVNDLLNIHQLIECGAPMTVEQRLQPGRPVRIKSGAMKGLEGVVIERRGQKRLLIAVNYLQQGVSLAIEDFKVEPI